MYIYRIHVNETIIKNHTDISVLIMTVITITVQSNRDRFF